MARIKPIYGFAEDLYVHFLARAVQLLRKQGSLYAITSDTYLTNVTKEFLRRKLLEQNIRLIMPMHPEVFRAVVYSCIIGLQKQPPGEETLTYCNARVQPMASVEEALSNPELTFSVHQRVYEQAFGHIFFVPTPANIRLFSEVLPADRMVVIGGRHYIPLELVAPALDTGIHTGNIRHKLFYYDCPHGKELPRLLQGRQIVRYWAIWNHPDAQYRYVDVYYQPNPYQRGIGRGGKPSGKGEYWHFCGPIENHHVKERLLMRQTEDEPFVGYIYQGDEHIYTDNTLHTLIITQQGQQLGITYPYLLAILNSASIRKIYQAITQEEGRTLAQVKTTIVNRLPIAIPTSEEKQRLEQLVQAIWDIYKNNPFPLPVQEQQRIEQIQAEIDTEVAKLYSDLLG